MMGKGREEGREELSRRTKGEKRTNDQKVS